MLDPAQVPPVDPAETVARFVLFSGHVRADGTVKPDAFMPHPHIESSVTRHRQATGAELWGEGSRVATLRRRTLYGRADVGVADLPRPPLSVVAQPLPENPNHANVCGWPATKPEQKAFALEIALRAKYHERPA